MAVRGGARPGAGRKPKLIKYAGPVAEAEQKIVDHLPSILDAMIKRATGVIIVSEETPTGVDTYAIPPDRQAGEYLLNRIMGKPVERVEHEEGISESDAPRELSPEERARVRAALLAGPAVPQ